MEFHGNLQNPGSSPGRAEPSLPTPHPTSLPAHSRGILLGFFPHLQTWSVGFPSGGTRAASPFPPAPRGAPFPAAQTATAREKHGIPSPGMPPEGAGIPSPTFQQWERQRSSHRDGASCRSHAHIPREFLEFPLSQTDLSRAASPIPTFPFPWNSHNSC